MVLSVQTKLLRSIDEHLISSRELWEFLCRQTDNGLSKSQDFFASLISILHQHGLQCKLCGKQLLFAELKVEAPLTLLFYQQRMFASSDSQEELAALAALLSALAACKDVLGYVPVNIQWLFDEGATEMHLKELKREALQPDACVCYSAAETGLGNRKIPVLACATKGRLRIELEVHTGSGVINSMHGGVAPDALWRLLWALGTLKDAREDILIEGFYDALAIVQDDVIERLHTLPDTADEMAQSWGLQQTLMGLRGFQLHYAHLLLPTCTVNSIHRNPEMIGGRQTEMMLSNQARAQVDFYLVPDQDPQDIFSKLQSHLNRQNFSDVQVHRISSVRPLNTPASNSFVQMSISATEKAYEQAPYMLPTTVGSYAFPALWMKDGTPTVFIVGHGSEEDKIHFARMIKQIALFIEGMVHGTGTTK